MLCNNREELKKLVDQGYTDSMIGEMYGLSKLTIRNYRKLHGISGLNPSQNSKSKVTVKTLPIKEVVDMYREGTPPFQIACRYGCHVNSVIYILKQRNLL